MNGTINNMVVKVSSEGISVMKVEYRCMKTRSGYLVALGDQPFKEGIRLNETDVLSGKYSTKESFNEFELSTWFFNEPAEIIKRGMLEVGLALAQTRKDVADSMVSRIENFIKKK